MAPVQPEQSQDSGKNMPKAVEKSAGNAPIILPSGAVPQSGEPVNPAILENVTGEFFVPGETNKSSTANVIEQDDYLQAAFENTFIGMAVTDLKGYLIQWNAAFKEIMGVKQEALLSKTLLSLVHPDYLKIISETWNSLISNKENSVTIVVRFQNKSAGPVWVRNSFSLIKYKDGHPKSVLIICVNINEEKKAQQKAEEITKRFRFLADTMPQQIWTADANGNLNYFSQSFYSFTGLKYKDVKNSSWGNIVYSEDGQITEDLWKQSVETGEEFVVEHRLRRRDGNFIWQLSRAIAQRDSGGKIIMWLGTISNIHRQKTVSDELEKQVLERTHDLEQANFNLKHSNHDLEQFAYIATHDLQEPLRKIRTYASWINKRHLAKLPEEAQDYVLKIEKASERMSVLIDDLLNYSLLLRPQEAYEISDMNYILEQVLADLNQTIVEKNAVIVKDDLPPLKVVSVQIYQLFYNLIVNSLKFSKTEVSPVIQITCRPLPEEEVIACKLDMDLPYIEIAIKDNGIGFMQEYAEKVFSIFQRLNSRNRYPGTGIGLALCQKIVTYHHGRIYAKAEDKIGASFYILLPSKI